MHQHRAKQYDLSDLGASEGGFDLSDLGAESAGVAMRGPVPESTLTGARTEIARQQTAERPGFLTGAREGLGIPSQVDIGNLLNALSERGLLRTVQDVAGGSDPIADAAVRTIGAARSGAPLRSLAAAVSPVLPQPEMAMESFGRGEYGRGAGQLLPLAVPAGIKGASVARPGAAQFLRRSAESSLTRVLEPAGKAAQKLTRETLAPGMLERRVMAASHAGLEAKALKNLEAAGEQLDAVWAKIPDEASVNTKPLIDALEDAKAAFRVEGIEIEPTAIQHLSDVQDVIHKFGDKVSPQSLRATRQIWDRTIARAKGFQLDPAAGSMLDARKEAADAIRRELARQHPDLAKVNVEFSFWSDLHETIAARNQRKPSVGIGSVLGEAIPMGAAGTLAVAGFPKLGAFVIGLRALQKFVKTPAWRTTSAQTKNMLAQLLVTQPEAAAKLAASLTAAPRQSPAQPSGPLMRGGLSESELDMRARLARQVLNPQPQGTAAPVSQSTLAWISHHESIQKPLLLA